MVQARTIGSPVEGAGFATVGGGGSEGLGAGGFTVGDGVRDSAGIGSVVADAVWVLPASGGVEAHPESNNATTATRAALAFQGWPIEAR